MLSNFHKRLLFVLTMERGRGAATMFYRWGNGRTFQPAELGKLAIIIALARQFADRQEPIKTLGELIRVSGNYEFRTE